MTLIQSTWSRLAIALLAITVCIVSTGCGNGMAKVTGQVTLDDQPITGGEDVRGTVYFYPESGTGAPAVGLIDEDGRYSLDTGTKKGIMPGAYKVAVSAIKLIPASQPGEAPSGRPMTPRSYADPTKSGLRVDVGKGSNTFDFALESRRNPRR